VIVSTNSGVAFNTPAATVSGDVGSRNPAGTGKHIVWNAGADLAALYFPNMQLRVSAKNSSSGIGEI
jgi:hypothetical protein